MLLTTDIGNTSITLGIFDNGNFVQEFRIPSDKDLSTEEYIVLLKSLLKEFEIDGCIIASVVSELDEKFKSALSYAFSIEPLFLDYRTFTGIKIKTDQPEQVGADRIANALAAAQDYNGAVIVIDFGTATSFDIINSKQEFIGGVISLGINTQLKCLSNSTSKLPRYDVAISPSAIGHNTIEAVLSGVIRGTACMVDGLIEQCENELGEKATIIATGGYCGLIANYMKRKFDVTDPILTLKGLEKIYSLNKAKIKN